MKAMLAWQGISRQGAHQAIRRMHRSQDDVATAIELAEQVRREHPRMGCRDIYYARRAKMPRGRDWAEAILRQAGFAVKASSRSFTDSAGECCSNLIEGRVLTGPDQVWQTDITHVNSEGRWRYVSFIVDVYSREIVGYHCSPTLRASEQVRCLAKALRARGKARIPGLIVHTDRGRQYTSVEFKRALEKAGIRQSMAHYAWQNAYCERVNRTIKEGYLAFEEHSCIKTLQRAVTRSVRKYNTGKPHRGLPARLSPKEFIRAQADGAYGDYTVKIFSKLTSTKRLFVN